MTLTEWCLLVVIVADLGAFAVWRSRMLAAEADIRDLKSNSNKLREAGFAQLAVMRSLVEAADDDKATLRQRPDGGSGG